MSVRSTLTVVTKASSYDLITLADLKLDLGIVDSSQDAFLARAIPAVSAAVSNHCNRVFQVETVRQAIYPDVDAYPFQLPGGLRNLQLGRWPIVAVTSVVEIGTALTAGTDYVSDDEAGQLFRMDATGTFPVDWSALPVVVTYSAGYAVIPADLQDAVGRMVRIRIDSKSRASNVKREITFGVDEVEYWITNGPEGNTPPDVADILDNYRVPVVT